MKKTIDITAKQYASGGWLVEVPGFENVLYAIGDTREQAIEKLKAKLKAAHNQPIQFWHSVRWHIK